MATKPLCSIPDCGKPVVARGWCNMHWKRWKAHGDPLVVKSKPSPAYDFFEREVLTYQGDDCFLWPYACSSNGYGKLDDGNETRGAHRMVCERTSGQPPTPFHEAAHSCGTRRCVNARHLSWKTPSENQADRIAHGTEIRGEKHYLTKLSAEQVREIRLLKGTMYQKDIAARYGVTLGCVWSILNRDNWAWLD